jgi:aryl-alcohol dehydrogenase-like predicted oxidoreductase
MISRRDWLKLSAAAGAVLALDPGALRAAPQEMIRRAIPGTGELVPTVGLGSSATFSRVARSEDYSQLREVLGALVERGGAIFDTAPSYGASEEVAGTIAAEMGITDEIFWATKVNVAGRGGGAADPAEARSQLERSFERLRTDVIDLVQVHNLGDPPTQLGLLQEYREAGRIRYLGITSTSESRYPDLMQVMRDYPLDFIGVDYAVDNRASADEVLPLAQERGIGVLIYAPFGRTRLWARTAGRELPGWAAEFDATTWAQFFLKYVIAHPAVTAATPATSDAEHMVDNLGGGMGRLPTEEHLRMMADFVDALPPAPSRR